MRHPGMPVALVPAAARARGVTDAGFPSFHVVAVTLILRNWCRVTEGDRGARDAPLPTPGVWVSAGSRSCYGTPGRFTSGPGSDCRAMMAVVAAHCQGRAAPSRLAAYQDDDRLTFSTDWPGCGASMIMLLPT
jgi:hypothetical protein